MTRAFSLAGGSSLVSRVLGIPGGQLQPFGSEIQKTTRDDTAREAQKRHRLCNINSKPKPYP